MLANAPRRNELSPFNGRGAVFLACSVAREFPPEELRRSTATTPPASAQPFSRRIQLHRGFLHQGGCNAQISIPEYRDIPLDHSRRQGSGLAARAQRGACGRCNPRCQFWIALRDPRRRPNLRGSAAFELTAATNRAPWRQVCDRAVVARSSDDFADTQLSPGDCALWRRNSALICEPL